MSCLKAGIIIIYDTRMVEFTERECELLSKMFNKFFCINVAKISEFPEQEQFAFILYLPPLEGLGGKTAALGGSFSVKRKK